MEGVPEPLVSAGKLVRDDNGQPIAIRRYSDNLLVALLRAHRPPRRERPVHFPLPAPQVPLWWGGVAIAVGGEGLVVGYKPGNDQGSALDLGVSHVDALTAAP